MTKKYYVVPVFGSVEPMVMGPYDGPEGQLAAAKNIHSEQSQNDSLFWLDIDANGVPSMGAFTPGALESEKMGA